jgi:5-methylcytosine-specific restriction endonuclease McrA
MPSGIYTRSDEFLKDISKRLVSFKGKKHSQETKEKMREIRLQRKKQLGYINSPETKEKISKSLIGSKRHTKKHTVESRIKMSIASSGENNWNWKGGINGINDKIRKSLEYKLWRESVFKRDNWTCIWCGSKTKIEADHIKPFSLFPELRFAIDNGRTLCQKCHRTTDTYGNKKNKQRSSEDSD